MIKLTVDDCETLIAFIKMHERNEISDDVWEVCMRLCNYVEEYSCLLNDVRKYY